MSELDIQISPQTLAISTGTPVARDVIEPDHYAGEYTVTPSTIRQTLETANKLLTQNVVVEAITSGGGCYFGIEELLSPEVNLYLNAPAGEDFSQYDSIILLPVSILTTGSDILSLLWTPEYVEGTGYDGSEIISLSSDEIRNVDFTAESVNIFTDSWMFPASYLAFVLFKSA